MEAPGSVSIEPHPGGWAAARETAARQPEGQDEREGTSQMTQSSAGAGARTESLGKLKEEQLKVGPKGAQHRGRCKSSSDRRAREWERASQIYTTKHRGRFALDCRKAAPKGRDNRPSGERLPEGSPKGVAKRNQLGTSESNKSEAQGGTWASQAGVACSNPFIGELALDCEIASLTCFASSPAWQRNCRGQSAGGG
jgi:hypothetical protein